LESVGKSPQSHKEHKDETLYPLYAKVMPGTERLFLFLCFFQSARRFAAVEQRSGRMFFAGFAPLREILFVIFVTLW
jgi:hypothetical protein